MEKQIEKGIPKILYWSVLVLGFLLAFIISTGSVAAAPMGSLTIKKFRVEDFENLKDATGQQSDISDVPASADAMADVEFTVEKLLVGAHDLHVAITHPLDNSFTLQRQTTDSNGEATFANLPDGYYLVTGKMPSGYNNAHGERFVVQIPMTTIDTNGNKKLEYDVVIHPKSQAIQVKKTLSSAKQVVGIDDIVTWTVNYPIGADLKKEELIQGTSIISYGTNFFLTDEMDERLDYVAGSTSFRYLDSNGQVIPGFSLTEGTDYVLDYDANTHILKISYTDGVGTNKVADAKVAFIELTLSTRVNEKALATQTPMWNNARIAFKNHSGDPYEHEVFPPGTDANDSRVPKVYLGEANIVKVDRNVLTTTLAGAEFALAASRADAEAGNFIERTIDENGNQEEIRVTTNSGGEASIKAIGAGTYYLVETKAPEGYVKLNNPIEVTIGNDSNTRVARLEVRNAKIGEPADSSQTPNPTQTPTPGDDEKTPSPTPTGTGGGGASGGTGSSGQATGAKTGDLTNLLGFLLLAVASAGIVVGVLKRRRVSA